MSAMEKSIDWRFNLSFGNRDLEALEWFRAQPNKGAYLKALILADQAGASRGSDAVSLAAADCGGEAQRFLLRFGPKDEEAWMHLTEQANKSAYLKSLILADKARKATCKVDVIDTRSRYDKQWEGTLALVQEFQELHDRLPEANEVYKGVNIGRWLETRLRRDKDNPSRMARLASLNIQSKWDRYYRLLQEFVAERGRLPMQAELYKGLNLGRWLFRERSRLGSEDDPLLPEQQEKLACLCIGVNDWETKFLMVQAFREEFGRLPKFAEDYCGVHIGRWLYAQRKALESGKDADHLKKLQSIGAVPFVRQKNAKRKKATND